MALQIPMVLRKAPVVGFGSAMDGLPVWVSENRPIKKQRDGRGLGQGGRCSMIKYNNQLGVCGRGGSDFGEEARGV